LDEFRASLFPHYFLGKRTLGSWQQWGHGNIEIVAGKPQKISRAPHQQLGYGGKFTLSSVVARIWGKTERIFCRY
jgi:hypothetical protein